MTNTIKSGFVAIVGRPNVGKSTLLNAMIGQKVAIVSPKPQTTRNRIIGILNEEGAQVVFLDTPGMHLPRNKLGEYMMKSVGGALYDVDAALMVVEADGEMHPAERELLGKLAETELPALLVVNKTDASDPERIARTIALYSEAYSFEAVVPLSAKTGEGVDILKKEILSRMEEGVPFFPEDAVTDQPERVMVAELIREKALQLLDKEVPHGIAVDIIRFVEKDSGVVEIDAEIYCEKNSHKGIIIGKGGRTLKAISSRARADAEELLDCKVYLRTWVKVKDRWRDSDFMLRSFGYSDKE